jgi:hypothetical protein
LVAPALFWLEFTEDEDREALKSWEAQNIYQIIQDCDYQLFKFAFALVYQPAEDRFIKKYDIINTAIIKNNINKLNLFV